MRIVDGVIRLAGADPAVVRPLTGALQRAADGKIELIHEQSKKRGMSPQGMRTLVLVLAGLGSVFLSILFARTGDHPPPGAVVLSFGHWLMGAAWLAGRVGPALLDDDDRQVLGWWPIPAQALLLARVGVLLKELLIFTAAGAGLPLVVFAFTGRPLVLASLGLGVGLLVQSCALALGVLLTATLIVNRAGRERARRLAALLADGNAMVFVWLLVMAAPRYARHLIEWTDLHSALPPLWAAPWGDPTSIARFGLHVAMLTASTLLLAWFVSRLPSAQDDTTAPVIIDSPPSTRHWTVALDLVLRPWTRTVEGWTMRRLLTAHMRDDWRVLGGILVIPLMFAAMMLGVIFSVDVDTDEPLTTSALMAINFSYWLPMYAPMAFSGLLFTSNPNAMWPVALADLDGWRLMSAQRRIGRTMILTPMLAAYGYRALAEGLPWYWTVADMLVLTACWETSVLFLQARTATMPFSQAMSRHQDLSRAAPMIQAFLLIIAYMVVFGMMMAGSWWMVSGWVLLLSAMTVVRRWARRKTAGRRLKMDLVPEG